jgi:hypothetical protein
MWLRPIASWNYIISLLFYMRMVLLSENGSEMLELGATERPNSG